MARAELVEQLELSTEREARLREQLPPLQQRAAVVDGLESELKDARVRAEQVWLGVV